jgi:hypothetical protein
MSPGNPIGFGVKLLTVQWIKSEAWWFELIQKLTISCVIFVENKMSKLRGSIAEHHQYCLGNESIIICLDSQHVSSLNKRHTFANCLYISP